MPATRPKDGYPTNAEPPPPPPPPPSLPADVTFHGGYWVPGRGGGYGWHNGTLTEAQAAAANYNLDLDSMLDPMVFPSGKNIGTSNHNYKDEFWPDGTPNAQFIPPDTPTKSVALNPADPPFMTGNPRGNADTQETPPPPVDYFSYAVEPDSLRDAEVNLRTPVADAITKYEDVKATMDANKGWMFSFDNATVPGLTYGSGRQGTNPVQLPKYEDQNPITSGQLIAANDAVLGNVADVLELVGMYMATLNDVGQVFVQADKLSFVPEQ